MSLERDVGGFVGSEQLQGAAAATLSAILSKRMDPQPKLDLIAQLGIVSVVAQWEHGLPGQAESSDDGGSVAQLARLLNVLALEVVECVKRLENHVISMQVCSLPQFVSVALHISMPV
jgi:exportin-T